MILLWHQRHVTFVNMTCEVQQGRWLLLTEIWPGNWLATLSEGQHGVAGKVCHSAQEALDALSSSVSCFATDRHPPF